MKYNVLLYNMSRVFLNEKNEKIDIKKMESQEQALASEYIKPTDVVLELGARYGTVTYAINKNLTNKSAHVAIEPDERVWHVLEDNMKRNGCDQVNIIKGFLSNKKLALDNLDDYYGYGATAVISEKSTIPSYTMEYARSLVNTDFTALVADCEGFLEIFFEENPTFASKLRCILFEADYPNKCNYTVVRNHLSAAGLKEIKRGHQNVWLRT